MKQSGFTLIELTITVAIIGIIAAVSWSAYESQTMKNRRSDAIVAMTQARSNMEKCYADNGTYVGCAVSPGTSPRGYYDLDAPVQTAETYTLTATPVGQQLEDDLACAAFSITHLGVRTVSGNVPAEKAISKCWGS